MAATMTITPMTPPTIAPIGVLLLEEELVSSTACAEGFALTGGGGRGNGTGGRRIEVNVGGGGRGGGGCPIQLQPLIDMQLACVLKLEQ